MRRPRISHMDFCRKLGEVGVSIWTNLGSFANYVMNPSTFHPVYEKLYTCVCKVEEPWNAICKCDMNTMELHFGNLVTLAWIDLWQYFRNVNAFLYFGFTWWSKTCFSIHVTWCITFYLWIFSPFSLCILTRVLHLGISWCWCLFFTVFCDCQQLFHRTQQSAECSIIGVAFLLVIILFSGNAFRMEVMMELLFL